ncbi:hypothetical protein Ocin01_13571, partial [Orchesella cincta]
ILLGIANSVYLYRPSVLLKRSLLRRRLLHMPINGTLRLKRQLFREDIPHHRPLSGNTYYLHAGFPHPSRWYDGPQTILPNPNPITHHHLQHHGHDFSHDNGQDHHHHNQHQNNELQHQAHPPPAPIIIEHLDKNKHPLSVTIQSAVVHNNGVIDNSIVNTPPPPPGGSHTIYGRPLGHVRNSPRKKRPPKPHSDPEPHYDDYNHGPGDYDIPSKDYGPPPPSHHHHHPPPATVTEHLNPIVTKKPKTVIHYHPVQVGNIINFNEDHKPLRESYGSPNHETYGPPSHESYGPPKHIPGIPLAHKDVMMNMAEPFLKSPFKSVNGEPAYLSFSNSGPGIGPGPGPEYGPPNHQPGAPLDALSIAPLVPSYGPPIKHDPIPPYGVALPVLAHFHSGALSHPPQHHPPPKRHRGRHQHHLHHYHHVHHHPPLHSGGGESPFFDVKYPTYVVHGHAPKKFPFHSPHYRSRPHKFYHWGCKTISDDDDDNMTMTKRPTFNVMMLYSVLAYMCEH